MSSKSWKDALLSTGQPLEHSVRTMLNEFCGEFTPAREFSYLRPNEAGVPTQFSVDIHTSQIGMVDAPDFWVDLLIECKYRHEGTKWIFCPEERESIMGPSLEEVYVVLDDLVGGYCLDRSYLDSFSEKYRFCWKGCEVSGSDRNGAAIEQAISQLKYAIPDMIADAMEHQVRNLLGSRTPVWIIAPILVTTAEMWRLSPGVTIEEIRGAKELSEVAEQHDLLVHFCPPDNMLEDFTRKRLKEKLAPSRDLLDKALKNAKRDSLDSFIEAQARYRPSHFIVVHYRRLKECLEKMNAFFREPKLYKTISSE